MRSSSLARLSPVLVLLLVGASVPAETTQDCARSAPLPPCNVWASRSPTGPANEVHVVVDPLDASHLLVVGKDYGLGNSPDCANGGQFHVASASYATHDAGATWKVARVPAPYPNFQNDPASPLQFRCGSDPVGFFGPDGTAYYLVLNFQYAGGRQATIAVARSPDGGVTWPGVYVRALHTSPGNDKEWGTIDGAGRIHLVWTDFNSGIRYQRTLTGFDDWEPSRRLAGIGGGNPAVTVATGPSNELYVVWRDSNAIRFTKSLDGGATFEPIRMAFTVTPYETGGPPRFPFMPQLAVDRNPASPFAGRVYLVWPDARQGDSAVFSASSGDGGLTWTLPVRVDDNTVAGRRQVMPTVSVAPNGRVDVAWLDQRDHVNNPLLQTWRAYAASSLDAGATWGPNRAVSEIPLIADWSHHQGGQVFLGDYMGIASTDGFAWPTFPGNGAERLAQGLLPDRFQRADAYVAPVAGGTPGAGDAAPPGVVESWIVGDVPLGTFDPADAPFLT